MLVMHLASHFPLTLLPIEVLELVPLGVHDDGLGVGASLLGRLADGHVRLDYKVSQALQKML